MIYWFTGQPGTGKTTLANKLKEFLQTEKRNWRKDVFQIDGDSDYSLDEAQLISSYITKNDCDIVVSSVSSTRKKREFFKSKMGNQIIEIFVSSNKKKAKDLKLENYEEPNTNFFEIDTTLENPIQSFTKLIHYLRENDKI
jgi:adenylylsulfate kinase-like enzyme